MAADLVVQAVAMQEQLDSVRLELGKNKLAMSEHAACVASLTRQLSEGEACMQALLQEKESSAAAAVLEPQVGLLRA